MILLQSIVCIAFRCQTSRFTICPHRMRTVGISLSFLAIWQRVIRSPFRCSFFICAHLALLYRIPFAWQFVFLVRKHRFRIRLEQSLSISHTELMVMLLPPSHDFHWISVDCMLIARKTRHLNLNNKSDWKMPGSIADHQIFTQKARAYSRQPKDKRRPNVHEHRVRRNAISINNLTVIRFVIHLRHVLTHRSLSGDAHVTGLDVIYVFASPSSLRHSICATDVCMCVARNRFISPISHAYIKKYVKRKFECDATQARRRIVCRKLRRKNGAESKRWKELERVWTTMAAENIEKWDMSTNEIGYAVALQQFDSYRSCMPCTMCANTHANASIRCKWIMSSALLMCETVCVSIRAATSCHLCVYTIQFWAQKTDNKNCFGAKYHFCKRMSLCKQRPQRRISKNFLTWISPEIRL